MATNQSPLEFAKKLGRLPQAVHAQQRKAIEARAKITKTSILAAALTANRGAKPNWVQYRIADDNLAAVRLRGGFAHLTELGSYKKPEGWTEQSKQATWLASHSDTGFLKELAGVRGSNRVHTAGWQRARLARKSAMTTPYGLRSSVHHPALRRRPFWEAGIDASRVPGHKAYKEIVVRSMHEALR